MSLVLEALRRVEKPDAGPAATGASAATYRPARRKSPLMVPLLLGIATGGLLLPFFRSPSSAPTRPSSAGETPVEPMSTGKGRAGLPPPEFPQVGESRLAAAPATAAAPPRSASTNSTTAAARATAPTKEFKAAPAFVLQAISERDSRPIAIINDQLVKEGDLVGSARVVHIGTDTVEVLLENGARDFVRFAPPPPPDPSPSPSQL